MNYGDFLRNKMTKSGEGGFEPLELPDFLMDFQRQLTDWAIRKGRGALYADCGLGKGPMQIVWADNVLRKTNRPVIIFAPLAVAHQFVREGEKFGIEVRRTQDGEVHRGINVTNYERMDKYDPSDFAAMSGDESGVIKHYESKTRENVTRFMLVVEHALLATATPAPNDVMELGTSAEALGVMKRGQMLGTFFTHRGDSTQNWELKGHGKRAYWRWVASWARAIRKPSDLGFDDGEFDLPPLNVERHFAENNHGNGNGKGFFSLNMTMNEWRADRKQSLQSRCEKVAELVPSDRPCVVWCHLNPEGDLLEKLIPGAVQVAGRHSDSLKEERLNAFSDGQIRVMITKPKIGGWGLNWQHCSDVICFPTYSYESYYQTVRRCWRFGQKNPVTVRIVATEAEMPVMKNMERKERQAEQMFAGIVAEMRGHQTKSTVIESKERMEVPGWVQTT